MRLSTDQIIFWQYGFVKLNGTIVTTWAIMLVLVAGSKLITRNLASESERGHWQNVLEIIVITLSRQIEEVGLKRPREYLVFLGTLFIFIATASLLTVFPGYEPPTGSLSTTTALALAVFIAIPSYGIAGQGLIGYLKSYLKPSVIMLPFNIIGELSRTLALAVRLFGNMMSGSMIVAILLIVAPLFLPVLMNVLGLLTGILQAYIFTVLATVYIAAATRSHVE